MSSIRLRLATRGSPLARWQAEHVISLLQAVHPGLHVELVLVQTTGDARAEAPISALGGQGVFVKEVQQAVLEDRADLAVHSAKDLPSTTAAGLALAAVPERGDPCDALVGHRLDELAPGATVATGSPRRRHQLASVRPDLAFVELRGNIATRLDRIPPDGAIVMAAIALERLQLGHHVAQRLAPEEMVPQVGQGALAVECRDDDRRTLALVAGIEHRASRAAVDVERAYLAELGGGCDLPVGAYATWVGDDIVLQSFLAGPGGEWRGRRRGASGQATEMAREEARQAADTAGERCDLRHPPGPAAP
jgi:hydroxymethylbilane synthase